MTPRPVHWPFVFTRKLTVPLPSPRNKSYDSAQVPTFPFSAIAGKNLYTFGLTQPSTVIAFGGARVELFGTFTKLFAPSRLRAFPKFPETPDAKVAPLCG